MPSADFPAFYLGQSVFSDPGTHLPRYADLPGIPGQLARIARNLVIHRLEGRLFHHHIPANRLHHDAETRYLDDILDLITDRDPAPLTHPRAPADRFVGVCRDLALLHCSFLRHVGVPARLRCGFADYLGPAGFHADHVATEYWDDRRGWLLADPQLADPRVAADLRVDFDPMDVPRDRFLVAGQAWRAIRSGRAAAGSFGVHPPQEGPLNGDWFVAHSTRLDLAALNKTETLAWDTWGTASTTTPHSPYDEVAHLTTGPVDLPSVRRLFTEHDALRTPKTVLSLAPFNGPREVTLR
ncbi:transglutaminase-like domain-containing protein [Streptomyces sp. CBMA156]|uniref:transglutaminase-like domain-containing protein n=1 Tax=Streptomyces sp. CBMA156 TaxID=1930280 RepID=UPI001661DEB6|nr:transglutaminase domain-containing protein [Streptomyces sp. CBMA156]MBD0674451.1 transglutaminase-like protein [Streptomyces sp. CBMA156]